MTQDNGIGESSQSSDRDSSFDRGNTSSKLIKENRDNSNIFVSFFRDVFGYRKTSLTTFVLLTILLTYLLSYIDNTLDYSVSLPDDPLEQSILDDSWFHLQKIAQYEHTYGSRGNDYVHDYLEKTIKSLINKDYMEMDNDLDSENNILFNTETNGRNMVSYYESNNILVRVNGSNPGLPALLLSAHYDSVPSSFGVTDDGKGIASLVGVLKLLSSLERPERTIIFNFNNNEEFGLFGATSFLSHPYFKQVKYFMNLEGTGVGGKAMLFRGTDFGIVKYFKGVRYPYANSIFQQGFNNHLIGSETDYKVYKEKGGIRGIDIAFYKPRDIYHTSGDNIKNDNLKSLWHMLSNSLDFVQTLSNEIDLDTEHSDSESRNINTEVAIYTSFFNLFFAFPISQLVLVNIILLVITPLIELPLFIIVVNYRRTWKIGFVNSIKYPISLAISAYLLNLVVGFIGYTNEFLPNSSPISLAFTLFMFYVLFNYFILNTINLIFRRYKIVNHDEKLVLILQNTFFYWILLLFSTIKLTGNKIGDDHSGEFPITFIFILQAVASFTGLLGWLFKLMSTEVRYEEVEETRPLIVSENHNYGSNGNDEISLFESNILKNRKSSFMEKYLSYDWSIQFLMLVPLSSILIYNSGFLVLDGFAKSIQESFAAELLVYKFLLIFAILWAIPFLPFVFKFNKIIVLILIISVLKSGVVDTFVKDAFTEDNPLKLRFIQRIDTQSDTNSTVYVYGRENSPMKYVLLDLPSIKESGKSVECDSLSDGMQACKYNSTLFPKITNDGYELINVDVIKNSSSIEHPFGLLTGEFKINVQNNRMCKLNFKPQETRSSKKESPVKSIIVFANKDPNVPQTLNLYDSQLQINAIPEGFSKDENGNYIFKNLDGIDSLDLYKLNWDRSYHIGVQWVPSVIDVSDNEELSSLNKLGVAIECHWADLKIANNSVDEAIPAYTELLHYTPNYISLANKEKGLVSARTTIYI